MKQKSNARSLGVFSLAMMNCAAVISLKNLPAMAEYGLSMVFFYAISIFTFLIPTALVSAELATGFPEEGGMFNWVNKALGNRWGFLAVWLNFISNAVSFPVALTYMASLIAYASNATHLASNNYYVFAVVFFTTWIGTWVALKGMRLASVVTNVGSILGTLIPGSIVIVLGITWILAGHESFTPITTSALFPKLDSVDQAVFFLNVLLGFAGLELSAYHAQDVGNPQRDYPRSIFISTLLIFSISILGSLAIAVSVPKEVLTLESGVIQAIESLFNKFGMSYLTRLIAWLMVIGAIAWFVAWVAGPARGMLATAHTGTLPRSLQKINSNGMPSIIIIWQAVIVTFFALLFLFVDSVTTCFWMLLAITTQLILVMYVLMFISGIILRFKYPDAPRAYKVPGGNAGMISICIVAIAVCVFCYFIGFVPPEELHFANKTQYALLMIFGNVLITLPPFIIYRFRKPEWKSDLSE